MPRLSAIIHGSEMPAETAAPDDRRLPLLLRLADIAALALAAVALWIALLGGRRYLVFGLVVSLRSALPFLYAAVSILMYGTCCDRARASSTTSRSLVTGPGDIRILPSPAAHSSRHGRPC